MVNFKKLVENILTTKGFQINRNITVIEGNNNITIQDVTNSSINITQNINDIDNETFISEIISKITKIYPSPQSEIPRILNSILFASPKKIIGRVKEVEDVMYRLSVDNSLLLVSGVGGIGKSVLAGYYYSLFEDLYSHVIWLKGNANLEEALLFDIKLLKNLGIVDKILPILPLISDPKNVLQRSYAIAEIESALKKLPAKTLVIIDDAGTDNFKTIQRWQSTFENFHFLITSREVNSNLNIYELGILNKSDALELFYNFYKYERDDSYVVKILEQIHYHTLLIELIAKAGEEGALPLQVLHDFLETGSIEHEGLQFDIDINELKENERIPEEERIINYIRLLFKTILKLDEKEKDILSNLSILPTTPHSKGILIEILKKLKKKDSSTFDSVEIVNSLNVLYRKGYLERDKGIYALHSLIATATREHIPVELKSKIEVVSSIRDLLYFHPNEGNPIDKFQYTFFGDSLLKHLPLPSDSIEVEPYTSLQNELGRVYRVFGNYERALNLMKGGIHLFESYGNDTKEVKSKLADRITNLSLVYSNLGDYRKAKELAIEAMGRDLRNFDMIHPGMVSNLASIFRNLGEYKEAIKLLEYSLEQCKKLFGNENFHTAHSLFNLGMCYYDIGNLSKALDLTKSAHNIFEERLGKEHVKIIDSLRGISMIYAELGDYQKSSQLINKVLKSSIQLFGENHPSVFNAKNSLAINYGDLGNYKKAIQLLKEILSHQSRHLGENHPMVALGQSNLSIYYEKAGDFQKAAEVAEISLEKSIEYFGPDNAIIATRMNNLAVTYKQLGKLNEAIELFTKAIEIDTKNLGSMNPKIAVALNGLGTTYNEIQDFENGLRCLTKALKIKLAVLDKNHPDVATTLSNLSDTYFALNDLPTSKDLIEAALKSGLEHFGENHPVIAKRLLKLGMIYFQMGEPQKAIDIVSKAINMKKELLGENNPEVAQGYIILGSMFGGYKQFKEAEYLYRMSYSIFNSAFGEDNYHTRNVIMLFKQLQTAKADYEKNKN